MKKFLIKFITTFFLSTLVFGSSFAAYNVQKSELETNEIKGAVLNWNIFTKSAATPGQKLDCDAGNILTYLEDKEKREALFAETDTKNAGLRQDVKGCLMESQVNKYATWIIFLGVAVIVGYLIYLGVKMSIGGEDSGGGMGGGMGGGFGGDSGGGEIWGQVKKPVYGLGLLVFTLVGGLNAIIMLLKFLIDLIIR